MIERIRILPEPSLAFRYGQPVMHPRDGLSIFGPYDAGLPSHPANISYGVVGTASGLEAFGCFAARIDAPVTDEGKDLNPRLWPIFPGFQAAFEARWPSKATGDHVLDGNQLLTDLKNKDHNQRTGRVVDAYLEGIQQIILRDEVVSAIVCVVPDIVYLRCRPQSRVPEGTGFSLKRKERYSRASGQRNFFESYKPKHYQYSVDFRRQIKARAMEFGVPIQIVRESTLRLRDTGLPGERGLTPLCDRAWNLGVAMY